MIVFKVPRKMNNIINKGAHGKKTFDYMEQIDIDYNFI